MEKISGNIYRNARLTAGLTQERWSEYLGISPDSVRKYESGELLPGDESVSKMAEVSGQLILPYWHLVRKSRLAAAILPELEEEKALPEAVLGLLIQIEDFRDVGMKKLLRIAADGKIDLTEEHDYDLAIDQLRELIRRAYAIGYAKD